MAALMSQVTNQFADMNLYTGQKMDLANHFEQLSLEEIDYIVIKTHGELNKNIKLSQEEKDFINRHLDVIALTDSGDICITSNDFSHQKNLWKAIQDLGPSLFQSGGEGEQIRAILSEKLRGANRNLSSTVQLYEPEYQWLFTNIHFPNNFVPTVQTQNNSAPQSDVLPSEFTLYQLANLIATGGVNTGVLGQKNNMNVSISSATPKRAKVVMISCQGYTAAHPSSGSRKGGRRRKRRGKSGKRKRKTRRRRKKEKKKEKKKNEKKKKNEN